MKTKISLFIVLLLLIAWASPLPAWEKEGRPKIQIALLLDTSSSMDGLIDQAKSQLWKIINELAVTHKNGKTPALEVALFEYGKSSIPQGEGYLRMITSFTSDLDKISAELYSLTTNGGDEYCGMVIESAVKNLRWDNDDNNLKLVFIAGNEPFDQGSINYKSAVRLAKSRGIIVNTIFCGDMQTGIKTFWKDGAEITGGNYISIDHNMRVLNIEAPQDAEISKLGIELNNTYLAYGSAGEIKKAEQNKQDSNAIKKSKTVSADRSISKASAHYKNTEWDLVDATSSGKIDIKKLDNGMLPAEMKNMNSKEQEEYIRKMGKKREILKAKINKLNEERKVYIRNKEKESQSGSTLDSAIIKSVREQAKKKSFGFKE
jgi:hypothetical protein